MEMEYKRYREISPIKTQKEYEETKNRLDNYLKEYAWITGSENPTKDIIKEVEKLIPMCKTDQKREAEYYFGCINELKNKQSLIKKDEYLGWLKRNITATWITVKQYELSQKEYTLFEILKGIVKRDEEVLEDLKWDRIFSKAFSFGSIPAEEDIQLEKSEFLLEYIDKHYNLVGINILDERENLLPVRQDNNKQIPKYMMDILSRINQYELLKSPEKNDNKKVEKDDNKKVFTRESITRKPNNNLKQEKQVLKETIERE